MPSITLIRHGQASFGAENYDQLSPLGEQQAGLLGDRLKRSQTNFDFVVLGSMHRHRQTAEGCLRSMGLGLDQIRNEVDPGWNEYDHQNILSMFNPAFSSAASTQQWVAEQEHPQAAFEEAFNGAVVQWINRSDDFDYTESWQQYSSRIKQAFELVCDQAVSHRNIAVFTSGGPISLISQSLLGVPEHNIMQLNWTLINCGITKVVATRSRRFIASLNDHSHFEGKESKLITYK